MSYVLGYIVADGCIVKDKSRSNSYTVNVTSKDKAHLYKIRNALSSTHKISKKLNGTGHVTYQLQIRNLSLARDLMKLGILPRKTHNLDPVQVPSEFFADFARGFFDGDGSVYIYRVNGVNQIKAEYVGVSLPFMQDFNQKLCSFLEIPIKSIHQEIREDKMTKYGIVFYISDCERIADFFYNQGGSLFLQRKRAIFKRWRLMKRRVFTRREYPSKIGWNLYQKGFKVASLAT